MKTEPIHAAVIDFGGADGPFAPRFDDRYHARAGAIAQAEQVFLRGNGLPGRWAGRERFVVLEAGFGLGHNFLATWSAWKRDPRRCERLHFVSIDLHPPRREDLERAHAHTCVDEPLREAAAELRSAWPPPTGDLHRLRFEAGRVELLLAFGDAAAWLRQLQLSADAIYLDGFAPERNPQMWSERVFSALPRLAAAGATTATWSAARAVRDGLAAQGFEVQRIEGFAGKREMTIARFVPRYRARPSAREASARDTRGRAPCEAIVIGAGLAGAAAAAALAEQGLTVRVLEAAGAPAAGASGNPAGLFRGLLARDDGPYARWHRAAALEVRRQLAPLATAGRVQAALAGVLQLGLPLSEIERRIHALALPPDYVRALDADAARALAGVASLGPAAHFAGGGVVDPGALVSCGLQTPGVELQCACAVQQLRRRGESWQLLGIDGRTIAETNIVVLANAFDAARLAASLAGLLQCTRGQVTRVSAHSPGLVAPALPLAHNGYVLTLPGGDVLCGATTGTADDAPMATSAADHEHNLGVLARLTGAAMSASSAALAGRAALRCHSSDRLPLVGALPSITAGANETTPTQPRRVPREAGLFTLTALGSRGIASAALAARTLAGLVTGAPLPIDADLLDAVDPARFAARAARRPREQM